MRLDSGVLCDARRRKQYRYHERWREERDEKKYARMAAFGEALSIHAFENVDRQSAPGSNGISKLGGGKASLGLTSGDLGG